MSKLYGTMFVSIIALILLIGICISQEKGDTPAPDRSAQIQKLIKQLGVNNKDIRVSAMQDLIRLKAEEAIPEMKKLLKDDNALVRDSAITTLGYLGAKEAIPEIKGLLKDENWHVRGNVVSVLGQLGVKEAIPEI